MSEHHPRVDQEFLDNYWDPQNVDLPPDHPIAQMYRNQALVFPADFEFPEPGGLPVEYRRVKLDDGSYELIAIRMGPR